MNRNEIRSQMKIIFISVLGHDNFEMTGDLSAKDVDGWDSLSHIMIITEIEKQFKIRFKLRELNKLNNLGNLMRLIMLKLNISE